MLKRKITSVLEKWKDEKKKPCLLIRGARQVGKTYIVDDFAKKNYETYVYINFEFNPEYKTIFEQGLDIETLIMQFEATFPEKKIIPQKTIIFLDEIQNCPNARVALKSFALDGRIDVIASRFFTRVIL
jgi:predicted AAA+ superfamily ATPase